MRAFLPAILWFVFSCVSVPCFSQDLPPDWESIIDKLIREKEKQNETAKERHERQKETPAVVTGDLIMGDLIILEPISLAEVMRRLEGGGMEETEGMPLGTWEPATVEAAIQAGTIQRETAKWDHEGSPFWKNELTLDPKTGELILEIQCLSERPIEVELEAFSNKTNILLWGERFDVRHMIISRGDAYSQLASAINHAGSNIINAVPYGVRASRLSRAQRDILLTLFEGESFAKSVKIWDLPIWSKLHETLRTHRNLTFLIEGSSFTKVRIDGSIRKMLADLEVDFRTVSMMKSLHERLKRTQRPDSENKQPPVIIDLNLLQENGDLVLSIRSASEQDVRVNLDVNFTDLQKRFGTNITNLESADQHADHLENIRSINTEGAPQNREVDLEKNEILRKKLKIWDLSVWPQLVETLKAERSRKYIISYSVQVELIGEFDGVSLNEDGYSIVPYEETAALSIDYRTMIQMEKLREASQ